MVRKIVGVIGVISISSLCFLSLASAAPTVSETIGGITQQEKAVQKGRILEGAIEAPRTTPEGVTEGEIIPEDAGPKVLVSQIVVEGVTLLTEAEVRGIIGQYEGQELSLRGMQKIADLITDRYRQKGYATSRAYIPPQNIKGGILVIRVVEGKLGSLDIKGNKYFKSELIRKHIGVQPDGYFDFSALQQSMVYINESPDRKVRAVLVPGAQPGTTDVVLEVVDNFPFHMGFEYDNYGSRYIDKQRYAVTLEHNNLFGHDDKMYFKTQRAQADRLILEQFRYIYPVSRTLDVGGYALYSKTTLGHEYEDLDARGEAALYGVFLNKTLVRKSDMDVRLNLGFDYKDIRNYLSNAENSRDELRVFKIGLDLDKNDAWGRTIFTPEYDFGLPIMSAMDEKDNHASRAGAGSKFQKFFFYLFRLQPGPLSSSILWKNSGQYSNHSLVASEEFQIGGPASVRGYPAAEHAGDKGYYTALEWSFPVYGLSKTAKIPMRKETWYDSLRLVTFYDWATVNLKNPSALEEENETLKGWGYGIRLNIAADVSCRVEIGYPIGKTPSDDDKMHPWVELTVKF